jgi:hypothetical protein
MRQVRLPVKSDAGRCVPDADLFGILVQEHTLSAIARFGASWWYNQALDSLVRRLERVFFPFDYQLSERRGSSTHRTILGVLDLPDKK